MAKSKPEAKPLTHKEVIKFLCDLAVWVEELDKTQRELYEAIQEHSVFTNCEIFKTKLDILDYNKKTPRRRIEELEQSLKGFIAYYYENQKETLAKPRKRYTYT